MNDLLTASNSYLQKLCVEIPERSVGSEGNRKATSFFKHELSVLGWKTQIQEFDAIDWIDGGATLTADGKSFAVKVSPYSVDCTVEAPLAVAGSLSQLENGNFQGKVLLVYGELAKEQLMPKNFVFYNPEEHQLIVSLLEKSGAAALVCATGRNPALAGGVYPFPLIEDGDFNVPSVYMTEEEGQKLLSNAGSLVALHSISKRVPGKGCNVIGTKGENTSQRIVVTAHIDAKKGTPGAIDNATGVVVLLLLAQLLRDHAPKGQIELVALNGEDYYAAPGQMKYIAANQDRFGEIRLNINIDGAGYREGGSVLSLFELPPDIQAPVAGIFDKIPGITEGVQWPQGDHSIFVQYGRPAIAASSQWFTENIAAQNITHTPKDNITIVDSAKIVELSKALGDLVARIA